MEDEDLPPTRRELFEAWRRLQAIQAPIEAARTNHSKNERELARHAHEFRELVNRCAPAEVQLVSTLGTSTFIRAKQHASGIQWEYELLRGPHRHLMVRYALPSAIDTKGTWVILEPSVLVKARGATLLEAWDRLVAILKTKPDWLRLEELEHQEAIERAQGHLHVAAENYQRFRDQFGLVDSPAQGG